MPLLRHAARVVLIASLAFPVAAAAQAQSSFAPDSATRREVLAVMDRVFETMRTRDTAGLRRTFHPFGRLVSVRGEGRLQEVSIDQFIGFVARDQRGPWIERAYRPEVRVSGTLATVWAAYDFHFGETFANCGVDAVHLLKGPSGWAITEIADTYVAKREDCPAAESR